MEPNESFSPLWKELNFSSEDHLTANITAQKYTHQASARIVLLAGNCQQINFSAWCLGTPEINRNEICVCEGLQLVQVACVRKMWWRLQAYFGVQKSDNPFRKKISSSNLM